MREDKSYSGDLMRKGTENEEAILQWLHNRGSSIIDFREFRLAQRIDVDFGIETVDGNIVLAEIKSDKWIAEGKNLLFEVYRINHHVKDKWFYLGWGWRSPANKLIIRNPKTCRTFVFDFLELRTFLGTYIKSKGKQFTRQQNIVETDKQKTTFNWLIPMNDVKHLYKNFMVE